MPRKISETGRHGVLAARPTPAVGSESIIAPASKSEAAVLGAILLDHNALTHVVELLKPEHFGNFGHRETFLAMMTLWDQRQPIDEITVIDALRRRGSLEQAGGVLAVTDLPVATPSAANVMHYAKLVHRDWLYRRVMKLATDIAATGSDQSGGEEVESIIADAQQAFVTLADEGDIKPQEDMRTSLRRLMNHIEQRESRGGITGTPTGFKDLDLLLCGLQPTDMIVLAARPSMGKTALALNIAHNIAVRSRVPTAFFSLEMSKDQLLERMLSYGSRIEAFSIRTGKLSSDEWSKLTIAGRDITDAPFHIEDHATLTINELRARARRLKSEGKLGVLIVDYLQLIHPSKPLDSREREVSEISRGLKQIAKELEIPVLVLSQLNRSVETRQNKRPMLSDLRESGAIEQDADVIAFIYREEVYNKSTDLRGLAEVSIAKHRNGPIGDVQLAFQAKISRFANHYTGAHDADAI